MNEDLSSIFEKLNINKDNISPEMVDNIMNMVNNFIEFAHFCQYFFLDLLFSVNL